MSNSGTDHQPARRAIRISDPYLDNPFRILKLSADATLQEIDRAGQKLQMLQRFAPSDSQDGSPGTVAIDEGDIRRAVQELKDPVRRLKHELFWVRLSQQDKRFWDASEELREFPLSTGGIAGDRYEAFCQEGTEILQKHHNLAVLYHAQAIAVERLRLEGKLVSADGEMHDQLWQKALRQWSFVLDSEKFWHAIEERITENNDPRLSVGHVRQLRETMPQQVLEPNVEAAKIYLAKVDADNASRHVRFLSSCDVDRDSISAALGRFYDPLLKKIDDCLKRFDQQLTDLDKRADSTSEKQRDSLRKKTVVLRDSLVGEVRPIVEAINSVGDLPGMGEERAMDEVAMLLRNVALSLNYVYDDVQQATDTLNLALEWVSTRSAKDKIQESLELCRENELIEKAMAALGRKKYEEAIQLGHQLVAVVPDARKQDAKQFLENLRIRATNELLELYQATGDRAAEIRYLSRAQKICSDPKIKNDMSMALARLNRQSSSGCAVLLALSTLAAAVLVGLLGLNWTSGY